MTESRIVWLYKIGLRETGFIVFEALKVELSRGIVFK